jgi:hypothetical protein
VAKHVLHFLDNGKIAFNPGFGSQRSYNHNGLDFYELQSNTTIDQSRPISEVHKHTPIKLSKHQKCEKLNISDVLHASIS